MRAGTNIPFLVIYSSSGGNDQIAVPDTALALIVMKTLGCGVEICNKMFQLLRPPILL